MVSMMDLFDNAPKIKKKPWMDTKKFVLGSVDNLSSIIDQCIESGRYACDLETSGLDNRVFTDSNGVKNTIDKIAGVGLSPDGVTGYYIPLRHASVSKIDGSRTLYECNVPIGLFAQEFKRLTNATESGKTVAVFHNGKFDQEFLQFNGTHEHWGEWDKPSTWDDTLILCYMRNSRARNKRLKDLSAQPADMPKEAWANSQCGGPGLGMDMIELYELFGHDKYRDGFRYDFSLLDPSSQETLWYAASDVICTWLLYPLLIGPTANTDTDGATQKAIYTVEKSVIAAERWMERCMIHVDMDRVKELITIGHKEWYDAIMDVYTHATEILGRDVMPGLYKVLQSNIILDDPTNLIPGQLETAKRMAKPIYGEKPGTMVGREGRKFQITYDVLSPPQLGAMFDEMDVPGLKHTEKSGQIATNREELDRVIEEASAQFPFMSKISRFREVNRALSGYLYPVIRDVEITGGIDDHGGLMRISFNGRKVDTGRYATSGAKENGERMVGFPKINFQSIPTTAFDPNHPRPECMRRLREMVTARPKAPGQPKSYIVAADYSGEELRLVTNLSGEPKWVTEFFRCSSCSRTFSREPRSATVSTPLAPPPRCPNCGSDKIGDLHTLTGIEIYGQDAPTRPEWKVLRGNSKGVNFGLCYGGGGRAVMHATGCDKTEGWRVKRKFDQGYSGLRNWWGTMHQFARKHSFVRTAFGRKYPLPDINHPDGFFKSKAERNAVNGPIQAVAADIIKISMSLVYKEMKRRGWLEKVMMVATMHDELVFEIDADVIEEALPLIVSIMTENNIVMGRNWIIPLTCDVEIGDDWTVPWDINSMVHKEVKFVGNKKLKDKKKCPEGVDYESLPSWPNELMPWFKLARGENGEVVTSGGVFATYGDVAQQPVEAAVQHQEPIVKDQPMTPAMAVANHAYLGIPEPLDTTPWEFVLDAPLTPDTVVKLANLIVKNRGRGTTRLKVRTRDGATINLDDELAQIGVKVPILVLKSEFESMARYLGLLS